MEEKKKIDITEKEIRDKEKKLKETEKAKKQILLRLSPSLWNEIAKWADEDFRSINGQIEYFVHDNRKHALRTFYCLKSCPDML